MSGGTCSAIRGRARPYQAALSVAAELERRAETKGRVVRVPAAKTAWWWAHGDCAFDGAETVAGEPSLRCEIGSDDFKAQFTLSRLLRLKPNTRYRVSFFFKTDLEFALGAWRGGAFVDYAEDAARTKRIVTPGGYGLVGRHDWTHWSFETETGPDAEKLKGAHLCVRGYGVKGRVWIDGLIIEERSM